MTDIVRQEILARIESGQSLRSICRDPEMPAISTVMKWVSEDTHFAEQYARALDMRADVYFDRLDEVSADAEASASAVKVAGLRLKADNIKWQLARMSPRKYGDKIETTHTGSVQVETIKRVIHDPKA